MTIGFVFPACFMNHKNVDEVYKEEKELIEKMGFETFLIDIDNLDFIKPLEIKTSLIYRGWMLSKENYEKMYNKLGCKLLVTPEMYIKAHYLPSWYSHVSDFTPKTVVTDESNVKAAFIKTGWNKVFVKDYVKSLKTGIKSIIHTEDDFDVLIESMKKFKGFIEGGLVLREVHDFIEKSEKRIFVFNNNIHSNISLNDVETYVVSQVVNQLKDKNLLFYSLDIIKDKSDKVWLVEIGDGQVSDYVGWNLENFVKIFTSINSNKIKCSI